MRYKIVILIITLFALCWFVGANGGERYPEEDFSADQSYRVLKVIDGDTIKIEYKGQTESVRLIGVDTPETVHPNKPVEFFGKEASAFTKNLLLGEDVYLRFGNEDRGKYNRILAYVFRAPDGLFVNLEIVRQGYGKAYVKYPFLDFGQNERVLGQKTRERENAKTGQRKELDTVSFSTMADLLNNSVL